MTTFKKLNRPRHAGPCLLTMLLAVFAWSADAHAIPVTLNFSGQLSVVGEYINAVPVPLGLQEFAPSFQTGQTITASVAYDTIQPDTDADPNTGTYRIGSLSINIPELGLAASRASNTMQISAFNDTSSSNDQFFAYVSGVDSFSNTVGLPDPLYFSLLIFGNMSMLGNDWLPTDPLDWTFGNASFDFRASDGSLRQVLLAFEPAPAIPEPSTLLLLGAGLAGLLMLKLKRRVKA